MSFPGSVTKVITLENFSKLVYKLMNYSKKSYYYHYPRSLHLYQVIRINYFCPIWGNWNHAMEIWYFIKLRYIIHQGWIFYGGVYSNITTYLITVNSTSISHCHGRFVKPKKKIRKKKKSLLSQKNCSWQRKKQFPIHFIQSNISKVWLCRE